MQRYAIMKSEGNLSMLEQFSFAISYFLKVLTENVCRRNMMARTGHHICMIKSFRSKKIHFPNLS